MEEGARKKMRERTIAKLERRLRGQLLEAATRLLSTAEKQAGEGRPHLLRTIVAISRSAASSEATKTRAELTAAALEWKARAAEDEEAPRIDFSELLNENPADEPPTGQPDPAADVET
jgi:hypothetical protein